MSNSKDHNSNIRKGKWYDLTGPAYYPDLNEYKEKYNKNPTLLSLILYIRNKYDISDVDYFEPVNKMTFLNFYCNDNLWFQLDDPKYEALRYALMVLKKLSIDTDWLSYKSPLIDAIQRKKFKVAKILVNYGADPNIRNKDGWTPFFFLLKRNLRADENLEKIKFLVDDLKVDILASPKDTMNLLMYVEAEDEVEFLIQLFKKRGISLNLIDPTNGYTALHYAALSSNFLKIKLLLSAGSDTEILSKDGKTFKDINEEKIPKSKECLEIKEYLEIKFLDS